MNNKKKYNGVLSPVYRAEGGDIQNEGFLKLLATMFGPITVDVPAEQKGQFTDEQDPMRIYRNEPDREFTKEEDPQGIYKGNLRKGTQTNKITIEGIGGK